MIYVTGDTHGDWNRFRRDILPCAGRWGADDTLIICGDFGFVFYPEQTPAEAEALRRMSELPFTIAFCDGNHENFPRLYRFPEVSWREGTAHRLADNVFHLMRGERYVIGGKTVLAMGGGYSIDKSYRREGLSWWSEEMPSPAEYARCRRTMGAMKHGCDLIVTHAAPLHIMRTLRFNPGPEAPLSEFLEEMRLSMRYDRWYFGHMHIDRAFAGSVTGLMYDVRNAVTGEKVPPPAQAESGVPAQA